MNSISSSTWNDIAQYTRLTQWEIYNCAVWTVSAAATEMTLYNMEDFLNDRNTIAEYEQYQQQQLKWYCTIHTTRSMRQTQMHSMNSINGSSWNDTAQYIQLAQWEKYKCALWTVSVAAAEMTLHKVQDLLNDTNTIAQYEQYQPWQLKQQRALWYNMP